MENLSGLKYANIARPYAWGAFEYARDKQALSEWKAFLASAANVVQHPDVSKLLQNPDISSAKLGEFFESVLASLLDPEKKNFLRLLAEHKRFAILPEIATLFNAYEAALEKISMVRVITAIDTSEDYREKLAQLWKHRLQREVKLRYEVDPSILGGAIFYLDDGKVVDASIRGKLTRLLEFSLR